MWGMLLHVVWDNIKMNAEAFDVVIVDETSQCGVEVIPLLFLSKKNIMVGDDK